MLPDEQICPNCGSIADPKRQTDDTGGFGVVLWLLFWGSLVVGLLFPISWLATVLFLVAALIVSSGRKSVLVCPRCAQPGMVPLDTPRGVELSRRFGG